MLNYKSKIMLAIVVATIMATANTVTAAEKNQIGVIGLYKVANPETAVVDTGKITQLGCEIRRTGIIGAAQGKIDLAQPNQFVFLACSEGLLGDPKNRNALSLLVKDGKRLAVLEGNLTNFPEEKMSGSTSERQYILKISHYNNQNADKRDSDLAALTNKAAKLPDSYQTESFIGVNHALGLPTPDEVVILYYDSPEAGDRFRKNNGNLMQQIGKFNQAHLVDAVYYVGKAVK